MDTIVPMTQREASIRARAWFNSHPLRHEMTADQADEIMAMYVSKFIDAPCESPRDYVDVAAIEYIRARHNGLYRGAYYEARDMSNELMGHSASVLRVLFNREREHMDLVEKEYGTDNKHVRLVDAKIDLLNAVVHWRRTPEILRREHPFFIARNLREYYDATGVGIRPGSLDDHDYEREAWPFYLAEWDC